MVFKKRILAPAAFMSTLALAGMAAMALTRAPESAARMQLQDVQIGERGLQTRIAFLCENGCTLELRDDGAYYLDGVSAAFNIDLTDRSARVQSLKATPSGAGAVIGVKSAAALDHAKAKPCTVGGVSAACLDLFFVEAAPAREKQAAAKPLIQEKPAPKKAEAQKTAAIETPPVAATAAEPETAERPVLEQPPLRESAPDRFAAYAKLAAPERLEPPAGAILAKVQPASKATEIRRPSILTEEPLAPPVAENFAERVHIILGKNLTSEYCAEAEETLQADAWAMSAMVDVGLCAAAAGDVVDGEEILARLLQYTPDNYEAYVGRALIAEQAGEKGVARKYFQDALNAPPPIEESTRIVEAMTALDNR